jgi:hypothetical protein
MVLVLRMSVRQIQSCASLPCGAEFSREPNEPEIVNNQGHATGRLGVFEGCPAYGPAGALPAPGSLDALAVFR